MRSFLMTGLASLLLASSAAHGAIICDASEGSFGNIMCENSDESNLTSVTISRMPRFGINSGLRLVSICNRGGKRVLSGKNYDGLGRVLEEVVGEDYVNSEARNSDGVQCVRRFCSENIDARGVVINGVFLPIPGPVGITTRFSFYSKNIEVKCLPVKNGTNF